jgi:hypothetical protein
LTIYRCILPDSVLSKNPGLRKVVEGRFTDQEIIDLNSNYYNIYQLPNYPSEYSPGTTVDGTQIDTFEYVFVDMDLKDGTYASKGDFIAFALSHPFAPSRIVDSGNGIHLYYRVSDLDAISYLRLCRRLMRFLKTDEAVGQIYQLMRSPDTLNTKDPDNLKLCQIIDETDAVYTCEELDRYLPQISQADEAHCQQHFRKSYRLETKNTSVDEKIPAKFGQLLRTSKEAKEIWSGNMDDRSKGDYRLGHIMFANGFTKDEARSVLINGSKALARAPTHRINYAENIIDKIWTFELAPEAAKPSMSTSVFDILRKSGDTLAGERFPCYSWVDNTVKGFRLGHVMGLIAGVGVGKTAFALNLFMGFVKNNPEYDHFFVPLEQPKEEIAERWQAMCGNDTSLHSKVQVLSNYDDQGNYQNLSLKEIEDYLVEYQVSTGRKIGCVVIDHIGVLKKKSKDGENQGLMDICHAMKAFTIKTNTFLVMQSQAPREKAGIGDLELNKDAAYGTTFFEAYCDYLVTLWQPAKRCYKDGAQTVTAFKFCKIRHKKQGRDVIQEDVPYLAMFDPETQLMRQLTQTEEVSADFFIKKATGSRKEDRKTDLVTYTSIKFSKE